MANINISDLRPADSASYLNDLTEEEMLYVEGGFWGWLARWGAKLLLPEVALKVLGIDQVIGNWVKEFL